MEISLDQINRAVNRIRADHNLKSKKQLAELLGYKDTYFSTVLNGGVPISDQFVNKLISFDPNVKEILNPGSELKEPKPEYRTKKMNIEDNRVWDVIVRQSETIHNQAETLKAQQQQIGELVEMLKREQERVRSALNSTRT